MTAQRVGLSPRFMTVTTVIFTPEMAPRFKNARMFKGLSQAEIAEMLFITQSQVSDFELGRSFVSPRFTLARFMTVMGETAEYVLFGSNREKYERGAVRVSYWRHRNRNKGKRRPDAESV